MPALRQRPLPPLLAVLAVALAPAAGAQAQSTASSPTPTEVTQATPPEVETGGSGAQLLSDDPAGLLSRDPGDRWGVASSLSASVDPAWSTARGGYRSEGSRLRTRLNAEMLIVHALAAVHGRDGAVRRDSRVEPLVRHLVGGFFVTRRPRAPKGAKFVHAPGWVQGERSVAQDKSIDAVAAQALAAAWRARDVVGLSAETRALMQLRMRQVVTARMWRWPAHVLNQISWSADVWAAHAEITGDPTLLRTDYRRALSWFATYARRRGAYRGGTALLNSGYGFRYTPHRSADKPLNRTDDGEYASITLGALRSYDRASRLGMRPLPRAQERTLARWALRVQAGSWAPNGYLNWDNGLGLDRIHLRQYWTLAMRGLGNGLAGARELPIPASLVGEARTTLDRTVLLYQRFAREEDNVLLRPTSFGIRSPFVSVRQDRSLSAARFAAGMAEAADRGVDGVARAVPRARVASDADIGRVAIGTDRYAAAFVPPDAKLRTGGIEPARVLDARAEPVTALGGFGGGALGLRVSARGRTLVDTQPGTGIGRTGVSRVRIPPSRRNRTTLLGDGVAVLGSADRGGARVTAHHVLRSSRITTRYVVRAGGTERTLTVRLPSFGSGTRISRLVGGEPRPVPARLPAGTLTFRLLRPGGHGTVVTLRGLPAGARSRVVTPERRATNPRPGRQLTVTVALPRRAVRLQREIEVLDPRTG